MRGKKKDPITDEQLEHLTRSISKLVAITTTDLNELRSQLFDLRNTVEALDINLEEVREVQGQTYTITGDVTAVGPTLTDVFVAELDTDDKPYELVSTKNLYVSGQDLFEVAARLVNAASDEDIDPTSLLLSVQYEPAGADGEPAYYAGNVAVVV